MLLTSDTPNSLILPKMLQTSGWDLHFLSSSNPLHKISNEITQPIILLQERLSENSPMYQGETICMYAIKGKLH
jgi:hypothetical protein